MQDSNNKIYYHVWVGRGEETPKLRESYPNQTAARRGLRAIRNMLTEHCSHLGRCYSGNVSRRRLDFLPGHAFGWVEARPCYMACLEHSWPTDYKPPPRKKPDYPGHFKGDSE